MKLSFAFLAGAALIAGAVIWAGGKPGGWFVGGLFTSAVMLGTSVVAIGIGRTGHFLVALGGCALIRPARRLQGRANIEDWEPPVRAEGRLIPLADFRL